MTEPKHTPLPWRADRPHRQSYDHKTGLRLSALNFGDPNGASHTICTFSNNGYPSHEEQDANAVFIVRACNEYYILKNRILSLEAQLAKAKGAV